MSGVDDDIRADFLVEAGELVERLGEQLVALENRPDDLDLLNAIFRAFHTVKGGAGFLAIPPLVEVCHRAEELFGVLRSGKRKVDAALMDAALAALDEVQRMMACVGKGQMPAAAAPALLQSLKDQLLAPVVIAAPVVAAAPTSDTISDDEFEALLDQLHGKPGAAPKPEIIEAAEPPPPVARAEPEAPMQQRRASDHAPDTSVRVDTNKLDALMNLVGELVLVRNRLKTLRVQGGGGAGNEKVVSELDAITSRLQGSVLTLRMQPIRKVFSRFPKLVRDISRGLGKEINVVLVGEETDLDKNLVDALGDPLMHMVRNSCDHGIEMPDARAANGKARAGTLTLSAQQQGDHILITVRDDGAGIDPERLRAKVVEKGLMAAADAARLDAQAALELIFMPGFSTKEQVTDLSGRGVGMDVVKSSINALNGMVQIESRVGVGTTFRLRVPLTLAILPTLMVTVAERVYAVPLPSVFEVSALDPKKVRWLDRKPVLLLREESLRLVDLGRWVNPAQTDDAFLGSERHVVVVRINDDRYGLIVNEVRGREEVVIKPLGALLKGLAGFAGATVTGDGGVALILDIASLIKAHEVS
ncbi:MAG: chemotaxis protein CheA [Pseudomonadota bacterium]